MILHPPRHGVAVDEVRAKHFGEPALRRSAPQIHLKQPVLRLNESLREEQVMLALRRDVRDAEAIADDAYRLCQARDRERAGYLRKRRSVARRRRGRPAACRHRRRGK